MQIKAAPPLILQSPSHLVQFMASVGLVSAILGDVRRRHDLLHPSVRSPFPLERLLRSLLSRQRIGEGDVDVGSNPVCVPEMGRITIPNQSG